MILLKGDEKEKLWIIQLALWLEGVGHAGKREHSISMRNLL